MGYNTTMGPDDYGFYTAGHCAPSRKGSGGVGGIIYQNTSGSANRIGTVTINPPWNLTDPLCANITLCAFVDASYVTYDTPLYWSSRVARLTGLSNYGGGTLVVGSVAGWFTNINLSGSSISYWQGIQVDKVGRTTGWTRGTLNHTCVTRTLEEGMPGEYRVLCADEVRGAYAGAGDSGAPWFVAHDSANSELIALGIHFAADLSSGQVPNEELQYFCNTPECLSYYSRISRIRMWLEVPY